MTGCLLAIDLQKNNDRKIGSDKMARAGEGEVLGNRFAIAHIEMRGRD